MSLERIFSKCLECGDCRLWQGATNGAGHPKLHNKSARRAVWEAKNGPIPAEKLVTVDCGHASCLEHLVLTTKAEVSRKTNAKPAVKLKRSAASAKTNRAKLGKIDMQMAREIRLSPLTGKALAAELNVSESLISHVRVGRSWIEHSSPWAGL